MSNQSDLALIANIIDRLDANRVSRFSYKAAAFDKDEIDSVQEFVYNADQNIPDTPSMNDRLLDNGLRAQSASLSREAVNHYTGRSSYNLNKIIQRLKTFMGLTASAWAQNAFEYDSSAKYAPGNVCYVIETIGSVRVFTYCQRTSQSPATIQGIPPSVTAHWTPMQNKTSTSALLPFKAPGYQHKYSIIDLTRGFMPDTWYPVVSSLQDFEAQTGSEKEGVLQVLIEAYCNGPIAGYAGNYKAELAVLSKFTGFPESSTDIVLDDSLVSQDDGAQLDTAAGPIGFSKLPKGRQAVLWLKGGAKYAVWNSFGSNFALVTSSYYNQLDQSITPVNQRPFGIKSGSIQARLTTPDATSAGDAVNLGQARGSLPLPIELSMNARLDAVRRPGSYYTKTAVIANSIGNAPLAAPGIFDLRVEGDSDGVITTTQHFLHRSTGDEYLRVLMGNTVLVPWYKASSPNGVYIEMQGLYAFEINQAGHLMLHYQDGTDVPAFHINTEGHLIANI